MTEGRKEKKENEQKIFRRVKIDLSLMEMEKKINIW